MKNMQMQEEKETQYRESPNEFGEHTSSLSVWSNLHRVLLHPTLFLDVLLLVELRQ